MKKFFQDIKNAVVLLLAVLWLIQIPQEEFRFILWVVIGVSVSALFDLLLYYVRQRRWIIPKSAIISGFIVAGVLSYHEPFWWVIIFSSVAIISKHLIKIADKHFLNPANAALSLATVLNIPLIWSLESNISVFIIILAGLYFVYRLKKWGHLAGFFGITFFFFLYQGINPLLMYGWFFAFIMLIEPKTSGNGFVRGLIFGSIAGISSVVLYMYLPQYNLYVLGLFIANLFNPILDRLKI